MSYVPQPSTDGHGTMPCIILKSILDPPTMHGIFSFFNSLVSGGE